MRHRLPPLFSAIESNSIQILTINDLDSSRRLRWSTGPFCLIPLCGCTGWSVDLSILRGRCTYWQQPVVSGHRGQQVVAWKPCGVQCWPLVAAGKSETPGVNCPSYRVMTSMADLGRMPNGIGGTRMHVFCLDCLRWSGHSSKWTYQKRVTVRSLLVGHLWWMVRATQGRKIQKIRGSCRLGFEFLRFVFLFALYYISYDFVTLSISGTVVSENYQKKLIWIKFSWAYGENTRDKLGFPRDVPFHSLLSGMKVCARKIPHVLWFFPTNRSRLF